MRTSSTTHCSFTLANLFCLIVTCNHSNPLFYVDLCFTLMCLRMTMGERSCDAFWNISDYLVWTCRLIRTGSVPVEKLAAGENNSTYVMLSMGPIFHMNEAWVATEINPEWIKITLLHVVSESDIFILYTTIFNNRIIFNLLTLPT